MTVTHGYYRHPTIHGHAVVFVCEDEEAIVTVDIDRALGGEALALAVADAERLADVLAGTSGVRDS